MHPLRSAIIFLLAYLMSADLSAQDRIDSLRALYASTASDKKVNIGQELLDEYYHSGLLVEGIDFGKRLLAEFDSSQNSIAQSKIHNRLGTIYTSEGGKEMNALYHLLKALSISEQLNWQLGVATASNNLGNVYRDMGYYSKAFDYYERSLLTSQKINDSSGVAFAYKNLGILAEDQGWMDRALGYHQKAYQIRKQLGHPREVLSSLLNLGIVYNKYQKFDVAKKYLIQAADLGAQLNSEMQSEIALELGDSYLGVSDFEKAMAMYDIGLARAKQYHKNRALANLLVQKIKLLIQENQHRLARQELIGLSHHLDSANYLAGKVDYFQLSHVLHQLEGNEIQSLRDYKAMIELRDSLRVLSRNEELLNKQNTFELVQKDAQIKIEKETNQFQQKLFVAAGSALFLVVLALTYAVRQKSKDAKKIIENRKLVLEKNQELEQKNQELDRLLNELKNAGQTIQQQNAEIKQQNDRLVEEVKSNVEEIIKSNTQIAQFASVVSHNLRAPVSRTLGLRHLLKVGIAANELEFVLHHLQTSIEEIDQTIREINKILSIATGTRAKIELIDLPGLVDEVVSVLQPELDAAAANIETKVAVAFAFSSRQYLKSIMLELLINSIKFRHETRSLRLQVIVTEANRQLRITIIDNGMGIDMSKWGQVVFAPYRRFHHHRTGRGFGLFLVKQRVEALQGTVDVVSEVGLYTKFIIQLPARE